MRQMVDTDDVQNNQLITIMTTVMKNLAQMPLQYHGTCVYIFKSFRLWTFNRCGKILYYLYSKCPFKIVEPQL